MMERKLQKYKDKSGRAKIIKKEKMIKLSKNLFQINIYVILTQEKM